MKISVCMMVKDEEALLPLAIASVQGLADEIIVVDTGSTDDTVRLAGEYGCKVLTGGDRRHKAQERNRGIEAASGNWVVILDADERIADPVYLRQAIETTAADGLYIQVHFMDATNRPTLKYQLLRVFKRGLYEYKYRAHETPIAVEVDQKEQTVPVVFEHRPPPNRSWKREHLLMLLLMDVEENQGDFRSQYYLAREYYYMGAWNAALEATARLGVCPLARNENDLTEAFAFSAECYWNLGRRQEALSAIGMAIQRQPQRREWRGRLAEYMLDMGEAKRASDVVIQALQLPEPTSGYVDPRWYGAHIYDLAARCYWSDGHPGLGLHYAQRAVELAPDDDRLRENLRWFESVEA